MITQWKRAAWIGVLMVLAAGAGRAQQEAALRKRLEQLEQQLRELQKMLQEVKVVVTARPIKAGTILTAELLSWQKIPVRYGKQTGATLWDNRAQLVGQTLGLSLPASAYIQPWMIEPKPRADQIVVKNGMRAFALKTGGGVYLAGSAKVGDRVDILATYQAQDRAGARKAMTFYLMRDVEIKALDGLATGAASQYHYLTFELSPLERLTLEYALQAMQLRLIKRPRNDRFDKYEEDERIEVTPENLMQFVKFAMRQRAAKTAQGKD